MYLKNLIACVCVLIFLAGCEAKKDGALVIGTSADNPPYEFIKDNKIVGMDIDIINAIGDNIGKKIIIKNFDFHGLLAALASKNVDAVVAALSVTPARQEKIDFTQNYTFAINAVLFRKEEKFNNIQDLQNKAIGVQLGTTWNQIAEEVSKEVGATVHSLSNNLMLVEELKSKVVDAIILEEAQAKNFSNNNPALTYFILKGFDTNFAIALPKGSNLKAEIDKSIEYLEKSGKLKEIREKWLK
ncbi:MAG: amino acid ABC transporter substrate-binding protein [Rickettsiaceae bacterium]|nr:MAG: amino acid ABC transporter substrate-binding protein [Rickettsiaceae bacterium]